MIVISMKKNVIHKKNKKEIETRKTTTNRRR